jgi:hypothetical protein
MSHLNRITQDADMIGGRTASGACRHSRHDRQRDRRLTLEGTLADYPYLEREDVLQALISAKTKVPASRLDTNPNLYL